MNLLTLLAERGDVVLPGDDITVFDHSLQTAHHAVRAGASGAMVVAALMHDVGHLVGGPASLLSEDDEHERVAAELLAAFGDGVTQPVLLHVPAKRYLAATDARYADRLPAAIAQSLVLQGGAMSRAEIEAFEAHPWFAAGLQLRRWDDAAQVAGRPCPGIETYAALFTTC